MNVKKYLVILFLTMSIFLLAIDKPGKDPEESWDELITLIKSDPNSPLILREGPKIAAKRRLFQIEELREAVLFEDVDKLYSALDRLTAAHPQNLNRELVLIFPEVQELVQRFKTGEINLFDKVRSLWKVGFKISAAEGFGSWLLENFLKNPQLLDWSTIGFLTGLDNKERISAEITEEAQKYYQQESYYPHLYRILEVARNATAREPFEFELQLSAYIDLLSQINRTNVSSLTKRELENMLKQFESIKIKKDLLRDKLSFLVVSAKQAGIPIDVSVQDPVLSSLLRKEVSSRQFQTKHLIVIVALLSLFCLMLLIDKIRLKILLVLRVKRAAVKTCLKILSKDPFDFQVRSQLAMLYEQIGEIDRAVSEYKTLKDLTKMVREQRKT